LCESVESAEFGMIVTDDRLLILILFCVMNVVIWERNAPGLWIRLGLAR
jgi:hypothetical protein